MLEWKCFVKNPEDDASEAVRFIADHIIHVSGTAFDDFVKDGANLNANRAMLGLEELMSIERPLRLGMIGGGQGAYTGNIDRITAHLDCKSTLFSGLSTSIPTVAESS